MVLHNLESGDPVAVRSLEVNGIAPFCTPGSDRSRSTGSWSEVYLNSGRKVVVRESYLDILKKWDVPIINNGEINVG